MGMWGIIYGATALVVVAFSLRGTWAARIGAAIIGLSWIMTNFILVFDLPYNLFLSYFLFDFVAAEILVFMSIQRPTFWKTVFLIALIAQLCSHVAYWSDVFPPRRYHEVLNAFYVVQSIAAIYGSLYRPSPKFSNADWLGNRVTKDDVVATLRRQMQT